jgi:hypothetical protein
MTKRKDAVALFDLINKGKTQQAKPGLNVPGWFSKRAPAATAETLAPPAGDEPAAAPPPMPPPADQTPAFDPFQRQALSEPLFQAADGRVKISLNYITAGATALGIIVALVFFFYLGRWTGRRAVAPPPDGGVVAGGGQAHGPGVTPGVPAGPDSNVPAHAAREHGKYYLIIDRMKGDSENDRLDALAAADYCKTNGYPCTLGKSGNRWALVGIKGFDSYGSREAMEYAAAVEAIGKNYRAPPGRGKYSFGQHRGANLDPSWHQEP